MNFSFDIVGFDFIPEGNNFGFWLFQIKKYVDGESYSRSLLGIYYNDGLTLIDLFWIHIRSWDQYFERRLR